MRLQRKWIPVLSAIPLLVLLAVWVGNRPAEISYNRDIRPIVNNKCIACHGGVKQSGGFSLLFEEEAKAPTESGKLAIIPGDSENSEMIKRLTHPDTALRMPLDKEPLSEKEIQLISDWIDQGAVWEEHWAYIPPDPAIQPPKTAFIERVQNDIDLFIFSKLEEMALQPSPKAEKELLLRRVYLDLIGLPPTKEDYRKFTADRDPAAFEEVVDSLLQSPSFGEKWAS